MLSGSIFTFFALLIAIGGFSVHAQDAGFATNDLAIEVELDSPEAQPGHIISFIDGKYVLSNIPYDEDAFGVVVQNSVVSIGDLAIDSPYLVATGGEASVKVTAKDGNIAIGDFVTTSDIPGVGTKADISGQIFGVALEAFEPANPADTGEILLYINPRSVVLTDSVRLNLTELMKSGFKVPFLTPLTSLRYILAALVVLVSFFLGFFSFSRISSHSIEALGRNPLAGKLIRSSILLNFGLTILIIAVGLIIAYLILTL